MESDGENVSPTLVSRTEKTVTDDSGSSSLQTVLEAKGEGSAGSVDVTTVTEATVIVFDNKSQNDQNSLNDNQSDDYYEVISADGSIGEDEDIVDIQNRSSNNNSIISINNNNRHPSSSRNNNFVASSSDGFAVLKDGSLGETCSFNDLPFVPKFEFPLDQKNSNKDASNYGANILFSNNIPRPDKNFTIPPPNYKPVDINLFKPCLDFFDPLHAKKIQDPTVIKDEKISIELENHSHVKNDPSCSSFNVNETLRNIPKSSKKKSLVVDWVDENGDPVPGAFDYVKPEEEPDLNKSSKVEYVFSVREKKDVPVKSEPSDVVNSGFLINQNVLHKNIAGNLGVLLENQLVPDPTRIFQDDEEKKLYEASKSGAEYKAALESATALSSATDISATDSHIVPKNENTKKDRIPRFRRNRFTDIKKEDESKSAETSEDKPAKSTEEVALERQAVTEILKEVQRGAVRAREHGPLGWQKCPVPVTNKTFLRNTLVSTLREPYRPPSKRGRFHVGLKKEDAEKDNGKPEYNNDSHSSRSSRSRSSSRSCSSCSRSRSSYTDDEHSASRGRPGHFPHGGRRGSWHRGHHHYYDEAWAAYNAHYGYPWYGPEALPMFYGPEGWPMDPYAAMYYGDPQAWMEYEAYYGPPNFNSRGAGRGFRGRGRGDRGRGRGGYEGDFIDYEAFQNSREFSPSRSRNGLSRSWSRERSQSWSRMKSVDSRGRSRSHSLSHSHSRSHSRSRYRSPGSKSNSIIRSDTEMNGKKKKKKKKKKKRKHKKSKKSKHKQKGEGNESDKKDGEGIVEGDIEKDKINNELDNNDRKEENSRNVGKDAALKQKKDISKQKIKGKKKKEIMDERGVDVNLEKKDGLIVSGKVAEIKDTVIRKNEHKDNVEESSPTKLDRPTINAKEIKRRVDGDDKVKERGANTENKKNKHKSNYSQCTGKKDGSDGFSTLKKKEGSEENAGLPESDRRSKSQDSRKRKLYDHRTEDMRGQHNIERDRSDSQDSTKKMRLSDKDGRVETADIVGGGGRKSENQDNRREIRITGHKNENGRGESRHGGIRISGNRAKDRPGSADISERDGKSKHQDSRKGVRITDHGSEDGRIGKDDVSDRRGENQNNRGRMGDTRDKYEKSINTSITERVRNENHHHRDKYEKDDHKYKHGSNTIEIERNDSHSSRDRIRKDGEKHERDTRKRETSDESYDSVEEEARKHDKHVRNIKYKEERERKGKYNDKHEVTKKDNQRSKEGRSERSQIPENDRTSEGGSCKQIFVTSHFKNKERGERLDEGKKIYETKEENIQKGLQTTKEREGDNKKIDGIRSGNKDKRSRNDSADRGESEENVNKKRADKMICGNFLGIYGRREARNDRDKSEERCKESRGDNERESRIMKINKVNKVRNMEHIIANKGMKDSNMEKQGERKYETGSSSIDKKVLQGAHKDIKVKAHESQQHDREKFKESSQPDKFQHKKIVHKKQANNENDMSTNDKDTETKTLDFIEKSNTNVDVTHVKEHSHRVNATSESKAMTESKLKSVKRSKKSIQKQEGKIVKPSYSGETVSDETSDSEIRKKKLKLKKKLKERAQEGKKNNEIE